MDKRRFGSGPERPQRAARSMLGIGRRMGRRIAGVSGPPREFNCHNQDGSGWEDRAREATLLLAGALAGDASEAPLTIADLGCGNERLRPLLTRALGRPVRYQGYDLHPQSPRVIRLDVDAAMPDASYDAIFCLGLLEYLSDVTSLARRLRRVTPLVVTSYVISDAGDALSDVERRARGWKTHHSRAEIEARFGDAGFYPAASVTIHAGHTVVWLWRAEP